MQTRPIVTISSALIIQVAAIGVAAFFLLRAWLLASGIGEDAAVLASTIIEAQEELKNVPGIERATSSRLQAAGSAGQLLMLHALLEAILGVGSLIVAHMAQLWKIRTLDAIREEK